MSTDELVCTAVPCGKRGGNGQFPEPAFVQRGAGGSVLFPERTANGFGGQKAAGNVRKKNCFQGMSFFRVPGYVFLQSENPGLLSEALEEYRQIVRIMEEPGYLISVYPEEEEYLRGLCGTDHLLPLSYGYKDRVTGCSRITKGPLAGRENQVKIFDWHRRFARMEISIGNRKASVWAGLALDEAAVS